MLTFKDIVELKTRFKNNENIIQYIKSNTQLDPTEAILHSYDLQAGSYTYELAIAEIRSHKKDVGLKLAEIFKELNVQSICEAGVGEATTLFHVLEYIDVTQTMGFDISMSRLLYGQQILKESQLKADLFCAELSHIPLASDSVECVYTFHSLEPNGGIEKNLLTELMRITKKYLVLIEPDYDLFSLEQKKRMDHHGYCKNLQVYLQELGANIVHYSPWEIDYNDLNRASLTIIQKEQAAASNSNEINYYSPISGRKLKQVPEGFFCEEDGFLFPKIKGIPVLLRKNAILISHYNDIDLKDWKTNYFK
jgi:ubiquinone/menaquinone biosynthesis C-methylase UbiE/uncharacterized protein YbaR (Trm112 family)